MFAANGLVAVLGMVSFLWLDRSSQRQSAIGSMLAGHNEAESEA